MRLPTVKIFDPNKYGDYLIVNESDYDPSTMRLFDPDALPRIRQDAIEDAIRGLDPEDSTLWTRDGPPNVKALEAVLRFNINANERDVAWAVIEAERKAASGTGTGGRDGAGSGTETA